MKHNLLLSHHFTSLLIIFFFTLFIVVVSNIDSKAHAQRDTHEESEREKVINFFI